jgi:hypothetical protein
MNVSMIAVLILGSASASAQLPDPTVAPADFSIKLAVDYPAANAVVSRKAMAYGFAAAGWVFECRSGLQPLTERVGSLSVWWGEPGGREYHPQDFGLYGFLHRPDVAKAYASACPSVGDYTGFAIWVSDLPPPGEWDLRVGIATWDGARRVITRAVIRHIVITE